MDQNVLKLIIYRKMILYSFIESWFFFIRGICPRQNKRVPLTGRWRHYALELMTGHHVRRPGESTDRKMGYWFWRLEIKGQGHRQMWCARLLRFALPSNTQTHIQFCTCKFIHIGRLLAAYHERPPGRCPMHVYKRLPFGERRGPEENRNLGLQGMFIQ